MYLASINALFVKSENLIFRCFKKFVEEVKEKERNLDIVNEHGEAFLAEAKVNMSFVLFDRIVFLDLLFSLQNWFVDFRQCLFAFHYLEVK